MKTFAIIFAGLLSAQAVQLSATGIDEKELMQNQGNHWRKAWPEGATDNGDEDSGVINTFLKKEAPKPDPEQHKWYEYEPHTLSMADEFQGIYH